MIVYQTDIEGRYIAAVAADESPLEPGSFLVPAGCVVEPPPDVAEGEFARWTGQAWAIEAVPPPPEPPEPVEYVPPPKTRLYKATIWRRVTDPEAEALDLALAAAPLRLRKLFEASSYLLTTDPDWPLVAGATEAAIGPERAAEVLEPEE